MTKTVTQPPAQISRVTVTYAYCCNGPVKYCDCTNPSHGTATMGANEAGDDYAVIDPAPAPNTRVQQLEDALKRIYRWHGEFPETGQFWDDPQRTRPMSYAACFGSNGERDFMRSVAKNALDAAPPAPNVRGVDADKIAKAIVLAACELDELPDPDDDDTLTITIQDLEAVANRHITAALERAALSEGK